MKRKRYGPAIVTIVVAAVALLGAWACDSSSVDWDAGDVVADGTDTAVDTTYDPGVDTEYDPGVDTAIDPGTDTGSCTYPTGPYAFLAPGNIVGPMAWPSAVKGAEETSTAADFASLRCEPGVKTIMVMIASTT